MKETENIGNLIVCPYCGREYIINEIFMPETILGNQTNPIRDEHGHIIVCTGEAPELIETYVCDKCNKEFDVEIKMSYVYHTHEDDFEEESEMKL